MMTATRGFFRSGVGGQAAIRRMRQVDPDDGARERAATGEPPKGQPAADDQPVLAQTPPEWQRD